MNYEAYINQKVTNYKGQKGYIVSFDQERVTVQLDNEQVIYKPDVAFKNKALVFDEERLNQLMNSGLEQQDAEAEAYKKKIEKINKEAIKINAMSSKKFIELREKDATLKKLFGNDFDYPPFIALKKKFPHSKQRDTYDSLCAKWNRQSAINDRFTLL